MSTKYFPNLEQSEIDLILKEEDTGYLCLSLNDVPYGVPVSYAFIDDKIIVHGALKGKKLDIMRSNPNVCFIVSRNLDKMKPHLPDEKCNYKFESVLCFGKAEIIDDVSERFNYLDQFKTYFYNKLGIDNSLDPVTFKSAEQCGCFVIHIKEMAGRRKCV